MLILTCLSKEAVDQLAELGVSQLGDLCREFDVAPTFPASCYCTLFLWDFTLSSLSVGIFNKPSLCLSLSLLLYIMSPSIWGHLSSYREFRSASLSLTTSHLLLGLPFHFCFDFLLVHLDTCLFLVKGKWIFHNKIFYHALIFIYFTSMLRPYID